MPEIVLPNGKILNTSLRSHLETAPLSGPGFTFWCVDERFNPCPLHERQGLAFNPVSFTQAYNSQRKFSCRRLQSGLWSVGNPGVSLQQFCDPPKQGFRDGADFLTSFFHHAHRWPLDVVTTEETESAWVWRIPNAFPSDPEEGLVDDLTSLEIYWDEASSRPSEFLTGMIEGYPVGTEEEVDDWTGIAFFRQGRNLVIQVPVSIDDYHTGPSLRYPQDGPVLTSGVIFNYLSAAPSSGIGGSLESRINGMFWSRGDTPDDCVLTSAIVVNPRGNKFVYRDGSRLPNIFE